MSESLQTLSDAIADGRVLANHSEPCLVCQEPATILLTNPNTGFHIGWACSRCWDDAYKEGVAHKTHAKTGLSRIATYGRLAVYERTPWPQPGCRRFVVCRGKDRLEEFDDSAAAEQWAVDNKGGDDNA